jgi:hypothetical protein
MVPHKHVNHTKNRVDFMLNLRAQIQEQHHDPEFTTEHAFYDVPLDFMSEVESGAFERYLREESICPQAYILLSDKNDKTT